jgi:hypothetical protein
MKPYLILDDNKDIIIPLEFVENTFTSKTAQIIKPLGDTRSMLNISMKWNHYKYLRDEFNKSWKRSLALVIIDNDRVVVVRYYGSFVVELTTTEDSDIVDLELQSDYHEINYDDNDELKSLFKSWEREVKLNQLGI